MTQPKRSRPVRPEALIDIVIAADARRRRVYGLPPARFQRWKRTWIEPFFNLLGVAFGQGLLLLPRRLRRQVDSRIGIAMQAHPAEPNPELPLRIDQTLRLGRDLEKIAGRRPALLILTSHPETTGPLQWLRFELMRQGLEIADAYVRQAPQGPRHHPRCFVAIDPYALDTVPAAAGAFYAGWMHRAHIAWDRQISTQSWIQRRLLLRGSGYDRIYWRLARHLKRSPVLMVFSGGLPFNSRLLYAAKEFVRELKWGGRAVSRLEAQKRLLEILAQPSDKSWVLENGRLSPAMAERLSEELESWGVHAPAPALAALRNALEPEAPLRTRLLNVLSARFVRRGQPLILLAITHGATAPHVRIREPLGVWLDDGSLRCAEGEIERVKEWQPAQFSGLFRT